MRGSFESFTYAVYERKDHVFKTTKDCKKSFIFLICSLDVFTMYLVILPNILPSHSTYRN